MKSLSLFLASFLTVGIASALDGRIESQIAKTKDGDVVVLSYSTLSRTDGSNKPTQVTYLNPLTISLSPAVPASKSQIRVVLVNKTLTRDSCPGSEERREKVFNIDLAYNVLTQSYSGDFNSAKHQLHDGTFEKVVPEYVKSHPGPIAGGKTYCGQTFATLEVAIVVDGRWLRPANSESPNFVFTLSKP